MYLNDRYSKEEIEEAADSLFESGTAAVRARDYHMAKIFVGMARKFWEEIGDRENAAAAEAYYKTIPDAPPSKDLIPDHRGYDP